MQENNRNISPIKSRMLEYIDFKGITPYRFYQETGVSRGILNKPGGIGEENIVKFLLKYPEVDEKWLLLGDGNMLKEKKPPNSINSTKTIKLSPDLSNKDFDLVQYILARDSKLEEMAQEIGRLKEKLRAQKKYEQDITLPHASEPEP